MCIFDVFSIASPPVKYYNLIFNILKTDDMELSVRPRPIKWSKEAVLMLIRLWKKWEFLYDQKSHLYYNKTVRADVLEIITKHLREIIPEMTSGEIRVKMHSLRTQFANKLVKIIASKKEGVEYEPKTFWFDDMMFLARFVKPKRMKNFKSIEEEVTQSETMDENTMSDPDELLVPLSEERVRNEEAFDYSSMSENDEPSVTAKQKREHAKNLVSETDEPTSTKTIKEELHTSEIGYEKEAEENNNNDVIELGKNIKLRVNLAEKPMSTEQEYEETITNFFCANLREVKNKDLQDELALKIMTLVFEYKRKQRELDKESQ